MKTLANAMEKQELVLRLGAIGPASQRRWGRMTVAEMVCHATDALQISMGEKPAKAAGSWVTRRVIKPLALWVPRQWPHGFRTVPECHPRLGGTAPTELAKDLSELRAALDRFTSRPKSFQWPPHPIFGAMSEKDWMRWGYLHLDHHLRQFGT
jgi:hypothetical protein